MSDTTLPPAVDARTKRNVTILVLAQAILGSQMPMIFTMAGLAGQSLASNPCWATLPISLMVGGSMVFANPVAWVMQTFGRRVGFWLGTLGGSLGAAISAYALTQADFTIFLIGSFLMGLYQSAQGFYRFAAADTASPAFRPKAISYVMAGGLASAIIGPQLFNATNDMLVVPFLGAYLTIIAINVVGAFLFLGLDIPKPPKPHADDPKGRTRRELLRDPVILVAIICGMVSYALMNLVMTSTPLAVVGCGFETDMAGNVVTAHVLAMFVPSFFTGHLITRFSTRKVIAIGLAILGLAGVVALQGVELENFFIALVLLGVGWNFGFIGATSMLAGAHAPEERGRVQGMNDMIVFGCVTIASLASGGLMNCSGGSTVEGWNAVNLAMVPFLALAGASLIWLMLRPQEDAV
ncbi:MFS transporter [Aliiroseovarius sp. Z3]|uniref:MFS transporter n=1 Tax=Aliiroseovarius sp. Z3 TaxID=2811402 RepID=UPI0023B28CFE|nr:MFS transporter [Aliiroseovarius sp. Z3]MDE9449159.1 MFS transporter [Aliiroseovarius sp. Z3]